MMSSRNVHALSIPVSVMITFPSNENGTAADHAEAKQRLRDAGFQVEDTRQLWGADRAFAIAPGGHRVELMAAPPPPKT